MESAEEGELEDGEISDETGSENVEEYDPLAPSCTTRRNIPSLMSLGVVTQSPSKLQYRGNSPGGYWHHRRTSTGTSSSNSRHFPKTAKYPASEVFVIEKTSLKRPSSDGRDVQEFGSGGKRRRDASKDSDALVGDRRTTSSTSSKQSRRSNRKQKQRAHHSHLKQSGANQPLDQDEYETLLRKHHEVQELIKQEKEKLTSKGQSGQDQQEGGSRDKTKGDGGQGSRLRSRSRSSSLKKDAAVKSKSSLTGDENDDEIVEVKNETPDIIEILDGDDEDDEELLQLRLLALESATKNVTAREEKENQALKLSKQAKQRERKRRVQQMFHRQSLAAEIFKVHGDGEGVLDQFFDTISKRRRSSLSSQGKSARRSPSIGKESTKMAVESADSDDVPKAFQFDNYEVEEMDVSEKEESPAMTPVIETAEALTNTMLALKGSDSDSPPGQSKDQGGAEVATGTGKEDEVDGEEEDDEDDVMALREQLLRSLASKRAAKAQAKEQTASPQPEEYIPDEPSVQAPVYEPSPIVAASFTMSSHQEEPLRTSSPKASSSSPLSTPRTMSPLPGSSAGVTRQPAATKAKAKPLPPMIPTHKPVVIQFGGDSDTSDEEHSPKKPKMKQINFLDQFLKEQRHTVDVKKSKDKTLPSLPLYPETPDAMRKLPEGQRAEYHKLKREIARREQQKLGKLMAEGGSSSGTQSPVEDVTISITKVDGKRQRTVVLKDGKKGGIGIEKQQTADSAKDTTEARQEMKGPMPKAPTPKETQIVKVCRGNLTKHRLMAEKDCRILAALDRQIQKQHGNLKQTETKLQQLREELAVGERIATSHRSQIRKYIQQKHLIRRKVQEHVTKELELRRSLAKAKGVAVTNIDRSKMLLQTAVQLPRTTATANGGKSLAKSETELNRLQRLEREYASQISKLRKSSAKAAKPTPSAVIRILKTKTKLLNHKPSSQILTKDKIGLGYDTPTNTDSESDAEKYLRTQKEQASKRRRSFLDENPSLKPNLLSAKSTPRNHSSSPKKSISSAPINIPTPTATASASTSAKSATASAEGQKQSAVSSSTSAQAPNAKTLTILEGLTMPSDKQVKMLRSAHAEKSKTAMSRSLLAMNFGLREAPLKSSENLFRRTGDVNMSIIEDTKKKTQDDQEIQTKDHSVLTSYTSPLLCFRSYRLSPFFVKESKLSRLSPSFSHKINPKKSMCKFELNGTCNDDGCPWQHRKDYQMTDNEIYADILAYTPLIAANKNWHIAEKREQRVTDYVNKAVKKSRQPETAKKQREALCRAFANAVLLQTKKASPWVIISKPRSWTPKQTPKDQPQPSDDDTDVPVIPRGSKTASSLLMGPLEWEEHERYYSGEGIANLEAAVLDSPGDVQMWIKLAYRIMGDESEGQDIDRGLNALSRGLEANQTSSDLWLHYLLLYSQRDDHGDLPELSQQALQFAPSYELYWQCLGFEETFSGKDALCEQMKTFLLAKQVEEMTDRGSHQLLEALLYRTQLHIMTRRLKLSFSLLRSALKGPEAQSLTMSDLCFAWLMYIHMMEYQQLPVDLFDPTGSGLGHIISKKTLLFQWGSTAVINSPAGLRRAFAEAMSACKRRSLQASADITDRMPLYRNLVILEQMTGRYDVAQEICQKLLKTNPADADVWLLYLDVQRHGGAEDSMLEQTTKDALSSCPVSAALYHAAAKSPTLKTTEEVVRFLRLCVLAFYSIPDVSAYDDISQIRLLYCSLLGQSLPFDYTPPHLLPEITSEMIQKQSYHLWLNYCLLQELTAEESQACEAYESSLCFLSETEDIQNLWMEYLLFQKSKMTSSQDRDAAFRSFTSLVNRCLISMATQFPLPHSDRETWLDYSYHNRVVELYVGCLRQDDRLDMYQRFMGLLPSNIHLAFRVCHLASQAPQDVNCIHQAKVAAIDVLNKFPECLPFWKILIALSLHQGRLKEAKTLYQQALDVVPLSANLWKDLFLLEVVENGSPDDIRKLVLKCRQLNVNIEDYLKTILK